jgi:hypothetical protein
MIDNDVRFTIGWLQACISVLNSKEAETFKIKIICPWNGNPKYDTIQTLKIDRFNVDIRERVGSPCWFSTFEYWKSLTPPPYGLKDAKPDDVWHWDQVISRGEKFAVLNGNMVTDITPSIGGSNYSARLRYVGVDYPKNEN